jgi:flagellar motility protein MotE (MotC chaperone)
MPRRSTPVLTHSRPYARKRLEQRKRLQFPKLRVLRLTMIMALLLCSVKAVDVYQGGRALQIQWQQAYAEDTPTAPVAEKKEAKAPPANAPDEEALEQQIAKLEEANDKVLGRTNDFSAIEVSLLQSLRERRDQIEERNRQLDLKEKLLEGTELRINDKIAEIKALEQRVSGLLEQYGKQEESHIRSLVKIYESMKPKSAAAIFDELELPILLEVIDEMSERKVAPILAAMNSTKAKEVTSDLAEMLKLKALNKQM